MWYHMSTSKTHESGVHPAFLLRLLSYADPWTAQRPTLWTKPSQIVQRLHAWDRDPWRVQRALILESNPKQLKYVTHEDTDPNHLRQFQLSVQFSCSVMSGSLRACGLQHARPPCPSPTPGVYSNSCPLSWWCHPTISSAVIPFSSCLQSFPVSGSFQMSQFLRIRWPKYWSFHFSICPSNEHSGLISFRMDWMDLLAVQGTFKRLLQYHSSKASILPHSAFFIVQLSHPYVSSFVITFLPRSKRLLISWLQSPSAVILEPPQNKVCHCFHCFPIYLPWSDGTRYHDLSFLNVVLSQLFQSLPSLSSRGSLVPLHFLPQRWCHMPILPAILIPACLHPAWHFAWCT